MRRTYSRRFIPALNLAAKFCKNLAHLSIPATQTSGILPPISPQTNEGSETCWVQSESGESLPDRRTHQLVLGLDDLPAVFQAGLPAAGPPFGVRGSTSVREYRDARKEGGVNDSKGVMSPIVWRGAVRVASETKYTTDRGSSAPSLVLVLTQTAGGIAHAAHTPFVIPAEANA